MATTILIVDDDKFTRNVLETIFTQDRAFRDLDLNIVTASDGVEGLEAFRAHKPSIVITDLLMPKLDGFGLVKEIRALPEGADTHLLVSSGVYRDPAISARLRDEYGASFYAKPYQVKELTQAVAKRVGARAGSKRSPTAAVPVLVEAQHGTLADQPLPLVLIDLFDKRASGRLTIKRASVMKTVDLVLGHPVAVTSNIREETLGHFLRHLGVIDDAQHHAALEHASRHGTRIGAALIAAKVIDSSQLVELLSAQMRYKISNSLRWTDGTWEFEPGSEPSNAGEPQQVEALVLAGLKESASPHEVHGALALNRVSPIELTPRGNKVGRRLRKLLGGSFGGGWEPGASIQNMLDAGGEARDIEASVDALLRAGFATLGEAADAQPPVASFSVPSQELPSVTALSEHSVVSRLPKPAAVTPVKPAQRQGTDDNDLFSQLFGESNEGTLIGERPVELSEDLAGQVPEAIEALEESGVIDVSEIARARRGRAPSETKGEGDQARRMLVDEYVRVQGLDHYAVLQVERDADPAMISSSAVERRNKFSLEWYSRFDLGRDYSKLEDLHRRYDQARTTLLDDDRRAAYDRELAGGDLGPSAPSLDAEIAYRAAQGLLERGEYGTAAQRLANAVEMAPNEADYHAELGWAIFLRDARSERAADEARLHLNKALRINPDHPRSHGYKGIITADLGTDDVEAIFHLERALEGDPLRIEPVASLEQCWRRRGELRPLERQYRKLIHSATAVQQPKLEIQLWVKLGALYAELDDVERAKIAYQSALRLSPSDAEVRAQLTTLGTGTEQESARIKTVREHWRRDPTNAGAGQELVRAALQSQRWDAAFVAASALVARGIADESSEQLYQRYRPRFVLRAHRQIDGDLWDHMAHPDDDRDIGLLFDLLGPLFDALAPLTPGDLEIDDGTAVPDGELPPSFARVRAYVAHVLCVPVPSVHVRSDFGHEVHIGAVGTPVLIVGDDILGAPERLELAFRLGRAMTFVSPGRALGGSRPARLLKQGMLGALTSAVPSAKIDDPTGFIGAMRSAVDELRGDSRIAVHRLVTSIARKSRTINLSQWARALGRTADRAGLLLSGDLPSAVRHVRDTGGNEPVDELIDFALTTEYLYLRDQLGVSVDV